MQVDEQHRLWYGSMHTRVLRLLVVREIGKPVAKPPLVLVTTDLDSTVEELAARYAARRAIEVTFGEAREHLGADQVHTRTRQAVEQCVPFALYRYTITVVRYINPVTAPTGSGAHPGTPPRRNRPSPT
ncbi:hypothetical protein ADL21_03140 [Streptomyces albus subsp. albus]|nr:hypothetical protein ADL21_03140 [Streptomyces albus subsp. albus]